MVREAGHVLNETDIYREWAPPSGWEEAVACRWEQRVSAARVQRVLPDGHADLIIYDTGRIEVVGLHDQVALPILPAGTRLRGIRFRPAAVAAAFGMPASLLRNQTVPADTVLSSRVARRLIDADAVDMWIRSIKPNPRTGAAVKMLNGRRLTRSRRHSTSAGDTFDVLSWPRSACRPRSTNKSCGCNVSSAPSMPGRNWRSQLQPPGTPTSRTSHATVRRFCGIAPARLIHERRSA